MNGMNDDFPNYKCKCGHYSSNHEVNKMCWKCYCKEFQLDNLYYLELKANEKKDA